MATGIERRTLLSWMEEPSQRAPTRHTDTNAERFTATDVGSTTTTVAAALTVGNNAAYVGAIMRCVSASNVQNVGCDVIVSSFAFAGDTLTHTAFPAATASGDEFVMFLPPDPIIVERAGGSDTVVDGADAVAQAADRAEADYTPRGGTATDYFIGDYVVTEVADNITAGTKSQVTAFNAANGQFTVASLGANTAIGDLFYLRRFPKCWGPPELSWKREDLAHEGQTSTFDKEPSVAGSKSWTASVTLPLKGSGSAAGNGVGGVCPAELDRPLGAIFQRVQSTGEAVEAGSTASVVQVTNGTLAQFPIGSWVMDAAGRMAVVTASAADGANPDDITVNPPLNRAPITAEILYGGFSYEPMLTGHKTMTLDAYVGGTTNVKMYGGMPTLKIADFARNSLPKLQFAYQGNYWVETNYAQPSGLSPTFDTVIPIDAKDAYAYLVVTGTTTNVRLVLKSAEVDFGIQLAEEPAYTLPDGAYGMRIVDMKPVITVTMCHDTSTPVSSFAEILRYMGGQTFSLMLQHGQRRGHSVGVYAHRCKWLSPTHGVADGLREITLTAEVLGSNLTTMPMISLGFC